MQVMLLLFNFAHLYNTLSSKAKIFVKIDRNQEKEQSLEKLLQSDLYPPIRFQKDLKTTFVSGGRGKLSSVNYTFSASSLKQWSEKNKVSTTFSVL